MQSQGDKIVLLPALPDALPNGKITGLKARGGFELDVEWREGRLFEVSISSVLPTTCRLEYDEKEILLETEMDQSYTLDKNLQLR